MARSIILDSSGKIPEHKSNYNLQVSDLGEAEKQLLRVVPPSKQTDKTHFS